MKIDNYFGISRLGSTPMTEVRAGLTTFVTMAYILPVNTEILSAAGLETGAVFMATVISSIIGCLMMGLWAKLPFALAPGMGLNAFFAFTAVLTLGLSPATALAAVLTEGLIFIVLSATGLRTKLMHAIPRQLQIAVGAGIGLFIMSLGLRQAGIVVGNEATLTMLAQHMSSTPAMLTIFGVLLTIALWLRNVRGALLIGILGTWAAGIFCEASGLMHFERSIIPTAMLSLPPVSEISFGMAFEGFAGIGSIDQFWAFVIVVLTFLYLDIFDTIGTFTAVMLSAGMMDRKGDFPHVDRAFLSDAVATATGALFGTSTVTTFAESAAGVREGGRTGLTAVVVALAFVAASFLYPLIIAIPAFATAPALIVVGMMMCTMLADFEWKRAEVLVPGLVVILFMITANSISAGLMWGVIFYVASFVFAGRRKEVSAMLWALAVLFVLKAAFFD